MGSMSKRTTPLPPIVDPEYPLVSKMTITLRLNKDVTKFILEHDQSNVFTDILAESLRTDLHSYILSAVSCWFKKTGGKQ